MSARKNKTNKQPFAKVDIIEIKKLAAKFTIMSGLWVRNGQYTFSFYCDCDEYDPMDQFKDMASKCHGQFHNLLEAIPEKWHGVLKEDAFHSIGNEPILDYKNRDLTSAKTRFNNFGSLIGWKPLEGHYDPFCEILYKDYSGCHDRNKIFRSSYLIRTYKALLQGPSSVNGSGAGKCSTLDRLWGVESVTPAAIAACAIYKPAPTHKRDVLDPSVIRDGPRARRPSAKTQEAVKRTKKPSKTKTTGLSPVPEVMEQNGTDEEEMGYISYEVNKAAGKDLDFELGPEPEEQDDKEMASNKDSMSLDASPQVVSGDSSDEEESLVPQKHKSHSNKNKMAMESDEESFPSSAAELIRKKSKSSTDKGNGTKKANAITIMDSKEDTFSSSGDDVLNKKLKSTATGKRKEGKKKAAVKVKPSSKKEPVPIIVADLCFQVPSIRNKETVLTQVNLDASLSFKELHDRIFQTARAIEVPSHKHPNIFAHFSKDKKKSLVYGLDDKQDWGLVKKLYKVEIEKQGENAMIELSFDPKTFLQELVEALAKKKKKTGSQQKQKPSVRGGRVKKAPATDWLGDDEGEVIDLDGSDDDERSTQHIKYNAEYCNVEKTVLEMFKSCRTCGPAKWCFPDRNSKCKLQSNTASLWLPPQTTSFEWFYPLGTPLGNDESDLSSEPIRHQKAHFTSAPPAIDSSPIVTRGHTVPATMVSESHISLSRKEKIAEVPEVSESEDIPVIGKSFLPTVRDWLDGIRNKEGRFTGWEGLFQKLEKECCLDIGIDVFASYSKYCIIKECGLNMGERGILFPHLLEALKDMRFAFM
ncbi:hypothetical protein M422DRAFT_253315 [Sphaerobolus stellatus SS14]|uniref:Uncharacterized protein n=1 Tax=Sphaerobolus stellatus (strain SS14) TaxID=990650 RepID=A0A0C9VNB0_SPHS4|nr:hypothetical protein M422DRAFT_253315 [Sphaerobolus stellatus SS14]